MGVQGIVCDCHRRTPRARVRRRESHVDGANAVWRQRRATLLVWAKSPALPPEIAIELIINSADPGFVKVTGCGLLAIPVCTLPKLTLVVLRLRRGVAPPKGVRKATICMIHWPDESGAVAL